MVLFTLRRTGIQIRPGVEFMHALFIGVVDTDHSDSSFVSLASLLSVFIDAPSPINDVASSNKILPSCMYRYGIAFVGVRVVWWQINANMPRTIETRHRKASLSIVTTLFARSRFWMFGYLLFGVCHRPCRSPMQRIAIDGIFMSVGR